MINEKQHKILNMPNVQELIKALDCTIEDPGYNTRVSITKRVDGWLDKLSSQQTTPRIIIQQTPASSQDGDIKTWIEQNKSVHGNNWAPF